MPDLIRDLEALMDVWSRHQPYNDEMRYSDAASALTALLAWELRLSARWKRQMRWKHRRYLRQREREIMRGMPERMGE